MSLWCVRFYCEERKWCSGCDVFTYWISGTRRVLVKVCVVNYLHLKVKRVEWRHHNTSEISERYLQEVLQRIGRKKKSGESCGVKSGDIISSCRHRSGINNGNQWGRSVWYHCPLVLWLQIGKYHVTLIVLYFLSREANKSTNKSN